ncbi:MAG: response regulator [Sulfurimonas sp.]|nr:response regulator [Sulfurimonas sp.]
MMERMCGNVAIANDGLEAWNIYQNRSFSIIVTDLNMPNMNGVELIKKIKAINPNQLIIVITAFRQEVEIEEAKKYGASIILEKPFSLESFLDVIKNMPI